VVVRWLPEIGLSPKTLTKRVLGTRILLLMEKTVSGEGSLDFELRDLRLLFEAFVSFGSL